MDLLRHRSDISPNATNSTHSLITHITKAACEEDGQRILARCADGID